MSYQTQTIPSELLTALIERINATAKPDPDMESGTPAEAFYKAAGGYRGDKLSIEGEDVTDSIDLLTAGDNAETAQALIAVALRKVAETEEKHARYEEAKRMERDSRAKRERFIFEGIAAEIRGLTTPHTVVLTEDNKLTVDGIETSLFVEVKEEWGGGTSFWISQKRTGKLRVTVGDYGDRKSFPQRKDGSFNYGEIALLLVNRAGRKLMDQRMERNRISNRDAAKQLGDELGLNDWSGTMTVAAASTGAAKPVFVKVKIEQAMSEEAARELHASLLALGYLKL